MGENLHEKHRKRVRAELLKNGFSDITPDHRIIETLLFFSIPRCDTNETAHLLLNRFGSVKGILEAEPEELMEVKGIGENSAALLKLMLPLFRVYQKEQDKKGNTSLTFDGLCNYIIKKHFGFKNEVFAVTTFNSRGGIIDFDILNSGDVSSVRISTRSVIETVIKRNAVSVVISHNHPNGNALPSNNDIEMTVRIKNALDNINVALIDHIIVADNDCVSLAQSKAYRNIFTEE